MNGLAKLIVCLALVLIGAALADAQQPMEHYKPQWTWPGSTGTNPAAALRRHLETTHGQNLAGLSDVQAAKLHDQLHGHGVPATTKRYAPTTTTSCPGGRCPTNTKAPTRWIWRPFAR